MRICQILAGDEEGGLEKHFEELSNRLASYHEIHVIAHEKYRKRFDPKIIFHPLDLSRGRRNIIMLYQLYRLINHIKPDIVHAHANKAVTMIASIKRFLHPSIKLIATLHSKKRKLASFEKFDYVIGVSMEVLKELKNPYQSVIYNGIAWQPKEKNRQFLTEFGIHGDEFVVCGIGRLEAVKNFTLLIHALKDSPAKLLIVGDGSERQKLQELAKKLSIEEKVIFTGFRTDVENILVNCDLMAISSEREGFSYVFVEALLNSVPVVSTEVSDYKHFIPPKYIVPIGDRARFIEIVKYSIEHSMDMQKDFQKSFSYAQENFTLEAMVKKTLKIYDKVK